MATVPACDEAVAALWGKMNQKSNTGHRSSPVAVPEPWDVRVSSPGDRARQGSLSPEIVLVDPELAAWARAHLVLIDPKLAVWARAQSEALRPHVDPVAAPTEPRAEPAVAAESRSETGRAATGIAARLNRIEAGSGVATIRWSPARGASTSLPGRNDAGVPDPPAEAVAGAPPRRRGFVRSSKLALIAAAVLLGAIALSPRSASDRPILAPDVQAQDFAAEGMGSTGTSPSPGADDQTARPPQTFVWPTVEGVGAYEVELFRDEERILVARTAQPRLTLDRQWTYRGRRFTLAPGSYRWSVRPLRRSGAAQKRGKTIVEAALVVER